MSEWIFKDISEVSTDPAGKWRIRAVFDTPRGEESHFFKFHARPKSEEIEEAVKIFVQSRLKPSPDPLISDPVPASEAPPSPMSLWGKFWKSLKAFLTFWRQ
jgi:hypothetical protein